MTGLISLVVTAGTYLGMHFLAGPHLGPASVDVPPLVGLSAEQARALTAPLGLDLVIDGQKEADTDRIAPGLLLEQRPLSGSRVKKGAEVHAILALPIAKVGVPAVSGQLLAAAQRAIEGVGLRAGTVTEIINATVPVGAVISTEPPAGAQLKRGETVSLQVAKAGDNVAVPNLRGRGLGSGRKALEDLGLVLGDVRKTTDDNAADGAILKQSPTAGTQVPKGTKVDLVVND